jgi:AhpD family alkylhydroperoxidase
MPARLRMNVMANPGVEKVDFELWSLAVSAINGCGMCIESHEHELRKAGVSAEQIQAAVRVAAWCMRRRGARRRGRGGASGGRPHSSHRRPAGLPINP